MTRILALAHDPAVSTPIFVDPNSPSGMSLSGRSDGCFAQMSQLQSNESPVTDVSHYAGQWIETRNLHKNTSRLGCFGTSRSANPSSSFQHCRCRVVYCMHIVATTELSAWIIHRHERSPPT
ncbi:hypothetical protein PHSY_001787 [Pseudozyma hubeiensis SY62]|uniref:Uncharacterized protein n=1 Tax=Pseudozyma hubeiensis (strain SY62) TaxID=1305764 RepID=R9NZK4_PSEHS|nr:hypothetical protein PHSY_001787 [Pseudozyma hubeiensis SY62]GAC94216.1 hypothetical protein PHSY_001787 [Pseudozyma hubeiensis SY62]